MFKNSSFFNPEEALEQGQAVLKKQAQTTVQAVKSQVTGQQGASQPADGAQSAGAVQDTLTKDFLKDLYAPSDPQKTQSSPQPQPQSTNPLQTTVQQLGLAAPQNEQEKMAEARKQLDELKKQHTETYYRPTFEERPKQEERAADKVEREEAEEKQKRWELQQEEQKKNEVPIALRMATNKAEMFRGAAG